MSTTKKPNREKLPTPERNDNKGRINEDQKLREERNRKSRRVNYIVKDLPIY